MVNYENTTILIAKTFRTVSTYKEEEVQLILEESLQSKDAKFLLDLGKFTEDICSNKDYCRVLGLDYYTIPEKDYRRVKVVALYLLEKYRDIV